MTMWSRTGVVLIRVLIGSLFGVVGGVFFSDFLLVVVFYKYVARGRVANSITGLRAMRGMISSALFLGGPRIFYLRAGSGTLVGHVGQMVR